MFLIWCGFFSQTFERAFIENWIKEGNNRCPVTNEVLSGAILIPNGLMKQVISNWCRKNNFELPKSVDIIAGVDVGNADIGRWIRLLHILSSSDDISYKMSAAKELWVLTAHVPQFCYLISGCLDMMNPILCLVSPLQQDKVDEDPYLQKCLIKTLFNISIPLINKTLICQNSPALVVLIGSLVKGEMETRITAASTLLSLSNMDWNKWVIGLSGAFPPLVDLLRTGHLIAIKEVAHVIFSLCHLKENKERAVASGAVVVLLSLMMGADQFIDELLVALVCLVDDYQKAVEEMEKVPGDVVALLFRIMMVSPDKSVREDCVVILHTICYHSKDKNKIPAIRTEEEYSRMLDTIAKSGTQRASIKAREVLRMIDKGKALGKENGQTIAINVDVINL